MAFDASGTKCCIVSFQKNNAHYVIANVTFTLQFL